MNTSLTKRLLTISLNFTWCIALAIALAGVTQLTAGPAPYDKNVAPAPLPSCDWSGFYIGLNAGVATQEARITDNEYYEGFDTATLTDTNFIGGGQVGYNFQKGAFVFGFEADGMWVNTDANNSTDPDVFNHVFSRGSEIDFMGTVRGRVGLAYENVLAYVTAGVAYANVDSHVHDDETPPNEFFFVHWDSDEFRVGPTAGVGIEYMMNCRWTFRVEALWADLGHDNRVHPSLGSETSSDNADYTWSFADEIWTARAAINYKFGGGH